LQAEKCFSNELIPAFFPNNEDLKGFQLFPLGHLTENEAILFEYEKGFEFQT